MLDFVGLAENNLTKFSHRQLNCSVENLVVADKWTSAILWTL